MSARSSFLSILFFVIVWLGFGTGLRAAIVETDSDSTRSIQIRINNSSFSKELETVEVNGQSFLRWTLAEHINTASAGNPDVPTIHRLIVVDPDKKYLTGFKVGNVKSIQGVSLYPIQPDHVEGKPAPKFSIDKKAYESSDTAGDPWVEFGRLQKLGRFTVMPVKIHLAQFNAARREIYFFDEIEIKISADGASVLKERELVSHSQAAAIEHLAVNGKSVVAELKLPKDQGSYLVLTSEDLLGSAKTFADRHIEAGYSVQYEVVPPKTSSTAIKAVIQKHYSSSKLDGVLLFGDETKVPLHSWGGTPGDSFYSFVDGDDWLADLLLGRVPASNVDEADKFIEKTSLYESRLKSFSASTKKVMLIAHRESYPGKYTANLEEVRKGPNTKNLEFVTQYGGQGAKNQSVIDLTSDDFSIINYRGHGSSQSWSGWGSDGSSFGASQISLLRNLDEKIAIFFNIACSNGALQSSSKSMAEKLLWPQSDSSNKGAIAVLAATEPSMTAVNHKYNRNLFTHLQATTNASIGLVNLLAANQLVRDSGGSIPSNNKMYILFGDPLLGFKHDQLAGF